MPLFFLLFQVSLKSPEVSVTLPIYIGNIAVNRVPLSPSRSIQHIPSVVVPSAPPEEEEAASGYHPMDNVSIPTKSHSQQQPFSYAPGLSFQEIRADSEQTGSPNHPTLCLSTGATVPYYAEGNVVPVPTASSLILPPEYSTWGYPYGEQRSRDLELGGNGSYHQSVLAVNCWESGHSVSLLEAAVRGDCDISLPALSSRGVPSSSCKSQLSFPRPRPCLPWAPRERISLFLNELSASH